MFFFRQQTFISSFYHTFSSRIIARLIGTISAGILLATKEFTRILLATDFSWQEPATSRNHCQPVGEYMMYHWR